MPEKHGGDFQLKGWWVGVEQGPTASWAREPWGGRDDPGPRRRPPFPLPAATPGEAPLSQRASPLPPFEEPVPGAPVLQAGEGFLRQGAEGEARRVAPLPGRHLPAPPPPAPWLPGQRGLGWGWAWAWLRSVRAARPGCPVPLATGPPGAWPIKWVLSALPAAPLCAHRGGEPGGPARAGKSRRCWPDARSPASLRRYGSGCACEPGPLPRASSHRGGGARPSSELFPGEALQKIREVVLK